MLLGLPKLSTDLFVHILPSGRCAVKVQLAWTVHMAWIFRDSICGFKNL